MKNYTFLVLDTETTWFHPDRWDKILEIWAIKIRNLKIVMEENFSMMFNPQRNIPLSATRVNKITDDMVANKPLIDDKIDDFIEFCKDVDFTLIHNAKFDLWFLNHEFKRLWRNFQLPRVVCTVELSKHLYPHYQAHNLDAIKKRFNLSIDPAQRHRALWDVILTADVFMKFYQENPMIFLSELENLAK